jgi:hypothetical protein
MQRRARYHRILLIACNPGYTPLWTLHLIAPSPTPQTFHVYLRKYVPRKIYLLPLSEKKGHSEENYFSFSSEPVLRRDPE